MENLALLVGTHALLLFGAALLLLLAFIALLWWLLGRFSEPLWRRALALYDALYAGPAGRLLPHRNAIARHRLIAGGYLGLHSIVGFCILLLALAGFVELADEMGEGEALGQFDTALARTLAQTLTPAALHGFHAITQLGNVGTLTALGIGVGLLLAWRRQWLLLLSWTLALAGNGLLNRALKALFQRVRPPHEHGLLFEEGWSFPSGHASGALVAYGMLAYLLVRAARRGWRLPIAFAAAALILAVGCSRIFLQVHFFSDVVAGYLSGGAWLAVCIAGCEIASNRRRVAV